MNCTLDTLAFFNMNKKYIWFLFIVWVAAFSCKKDFSRQPIVSTGEFDLTMAIAHGTLVDLGTKEITDHGFCWDSLGEPNITHQTLQLGALSNAGGFQAQLTSLKAQKTYYLKAFITYGEEVLYGSMVTYTTPDLPEITTTIVTEITETYAKSGGDITSDNGSPVIVRGVCWGTASNPDTLGSHTSDGSGTGSFSSVLSGLTANTSYYVRAYATSIYGTRYSDELTFNTGQSATTPFVSTYPVSEITQTTATSGGNVVADGGSSVTLRGVCWSTNPYPTTTDSKTEDGSGTGVFSSSLSSLSANTTYYLRAYATNEIGTSYGNEVSFTTDQAPNLPTVLTASITDITQTSANSGGTVTADGGTAVTARGVCWSTTSNPTISNTHTTDGSGLGGFVSSITGLTANTTYYVRAYATNGAGAAYGNEISFTAGQSVTTPTVLTSETSNISQTSATSGGDVTSDGGATVTARGVCWSTTSNPSLTNSHSSDGTGTGTFVSSISGLTPNTTYYVRAYATNAAGTSYGNEKTFTTLSEIIIPSVSTAPVTNITPTTAQSGGTITNNGGASVTARGVCWSTQQNPDLGDSHTSDGTGTGSFTSIMTGLTANTFYYVRAYATNTAGTAYGNQLTFMTIENPVLPTVTTADAMNITQTEATTGGTVHTDGGATVSARGVCYSTTPNPTLANDYTTNGSGLGTFVSILTNLSPNTQYYVRAYATNSVGTAYGNEISFTTLAQPWQCGDTIDYSGQIYNTVLIGTQCWMKENLNVGVMINSSQNQTNNSQIEKYCYDDDPTNCIEYGGLYQWGEMMNYTGSSSSIPSGRQGICPMGWHLPSNPEITLLITQLGGEAVAGGKMKEDGYVHWDPPNLGATNESGFTAIGSGRRHNSTPFFMQLKTNCQIWSCTQDGSDLAWFINMQNNIVNTTNQHGFKTLGFTSRCLKD